MAGLLEKRVSPNFYIGHECDLNLSWFLANSTTFFANHRQLTTYFLTLQISLVALYERANATNPSKRLELVEEPQLQLFNIGKK